MEEDRIAAGDRQFVASLARGLSVLTAFQAADRALGNRDLAERTGLPRPTVARFAHTLCRLGYLTFHARRGRYGLAPRTLELSQAAEAAIGLREVIRPAMVSLAEIGEVSVALGVPSGAQVRYIALERRPEAIVLNLDVGALLPVPQTAIGRAWLAALPEAERAAATERIAADDPALWRAQSARVAEEGARMRAQGFAASFGDWRPELNAIACPIRFADTGGAMMMSVAGLSSVFTPELAENEVSPALIGAVRGIESRLRRYYE